MSRDPSSVNERKALDNANVGPVSSQSEITYFHAFLQQICGAFLSHGGYPSYHPFIDGMFHEINHPAIGVPPWKPDIYGHCG